MSTSSVSSVSSSSAVTSTVTSDFVNKIRTQAASFSKNPPRRELPVRSTETTQEDREKACELLITAVKRLIEPQVEKYASLGRDEARIMDFKFSDKLKYGSCYAKDLFEKTDVIKRLQSYLDETYLENGQPAFKIYFTRVGHPDTTNRNNKYGVFINWNRNTWAAISEKQKAPFQKTEFHQKSTEFRSKPVEFRPRLTVQRRSLPKSETEEVKTELPTELTE